MTPLRDLPALTVRILRDPVRSVREPLDFSWPLIATLIAAGAMISGGVAGAVARNWLDVAIGLIVFPITSLVCSVVFGFFIYYFFSLFQSTFLDFRRLMSLVVVALLPYFLFHSASGYLAPIDLLGFAFTCVLLIVGLVEQFGLSRRVCSRLIVSLYVLFFIVWSFSQIRTSGNL